MNDSENGSLKKESKENSASLPHTFASYLDNFGAFFQKDEDIDSAIKSLLISYKISDSSNTLIALMEIFVEHKMFNNALELAKGHIKRNPDDFEFYKIVEDIEKKKSVFNTNKKMGLGEFKSNLKLDPVLCFVHIPKAGGTTLWKILQKQLPGCREHEHFTTPEKYRGFINKEMKVKESYDLLGGHTAYGVHQHIDREVKYITMFRKPADRLISGYYYMITYPGHPSHKRFIEEGIKLSDFIQMGAGNDQLQTILDKSNHERLDLETGKRNLREDFCFVGITEEFDASLIILRNKLKWKISPFYIKRNITQFRLQVNEVDRNIIDTIKKNNSLDYELYDYARELFEREKEEYGESLEKDVKEFKYFNALYNELIQE